MVAPPEEGANGSFTIGTGRVYPLMFIANTRDLHLALIAPVRTFHKCQIHQISRAKVIMLSAQLFDKQRQEEQVEVGVRQPQPPGVYR